MKSLYEKPRNYRRRALFMTMLSMALVYVIWNIPALNPILYPLQLFTTFVHEAGHGLAAILTGGSIQEFVVNPRGPLWGYALTAGGIQAIILPAGYIGAAAFGSILYLIVNRFARYVNIISFALGAALIMFSILYGSPTEGGLPLALILGVGGGLGMILLARWGKPLMTLLVLQIIAVSTALEAVLDLRMMIVNSSRLSDMNDAAAFSNQVTPLLPTYFVALSWAAISILLFVIAFYYGTWRPLFSELDTTYDSIARR